MDDLERAEELERHDRELRIAEARRPSAVSHPVLDCVDCKGIAQEEAKESCEFFAPCVADWAKIQRAKSINGKGEI